MPNLQVTILLHTIRVDSRVARINLFLQVVLPTGEAKCMLALHAEAVCLTKLIVANWTIAAMLVRQRAIDFGMSFGKRRIEF